MKNDLYGKGQIGLPTQVYIVFYNGSGMQMDRLMLYLSDAYQTGRGSGAYGNRKLYRERDPEGYAVGRERRGGAYALNGI